MPVSGDKRGDEDGGVASNDAADEHDRDEVAYAFPAEEDLTEQDQQDGEGGENGTRKSLIHAQIDNLGIGHPTALKKTQIFPLPVKRDNGIVDRVPDEGQKGGHHLKRKLSAAECVDAHGDNDVVHQGDVGRDRVGELEADHHVNDHADHGKDQRDDRGFQEGGSDERAQSVGGFLGELNLRIFRIQIPDQVVRDRFGDVGFVVFRTADHDLQLAGAVLVVVVGNLLVGGTGVVALGLQIVVDLRDRHAFGALFQRNVLDDQLRTAGEVDSQHVGSAVTEDADRSHQTEDGKGNNELSGADEVEVRILEEQHHLKILNVQERDPENQNVKFRKEPWGI